MITVETIRDKRYIPQTEGAIEIKSACGQKIMAYPGTFLYTSAQKAIEQLTKEGRNGRGKKTKKDN